MIRRRFLPLVLAAASVAGPAWPETDSQSARSVVQIRCPTEGGEMKATGFVWPEPGLVVTALHAVAGCSGGFVYSESARRETDIAGFVAVDLEGDLALLRLAEDLGLAPVPIVDGEPDIRGDHFVWGYPLTAEELIDLRLEFAGGLDGGMTTLGRAFSSADLVKLFREQDYPNRDTRILRVTTTIQPGHSGAPIFDAQGRVAAIADGGLLGGWRGINWSIPAHFYLPGLPASTDPIPGGVSHQAQLFSAYAVTEPKSVSLGPPADDPPPPGTLTIAGQVSVSDILGAMAAPTVDDEWVVDELAAVLPQGKGLDTLLAYLDPAWDEPVFVPATASVVYDAERGLLEATGAGGDLLQIDYGADETTFDEALQNGNAAFFGRLAALGIAGVPTEIPEDAIDRDLEFAEYRDFLQDPGGASVSFVVEVNGPFYYGRAVHSARPVETIDDAGYAYVDALDDAEYVEFLLMDLATHWLNRMEWLAAGVAALLEAPGGADIGREAPEPSELSLVRRVPLADVAQDFVADADFAWKRDLAYLRWHLEPGEYEDLAFDVYEDRVTGATIAVPGGLDLAWDPELGAVVGEAAGGRVRLAIAIDRATDFEAAIDGVSWAFVSQLAALIDWSDRSPADCAIDIDPDTETADCWEIFVGTDPASGEFADLSLALSVRGPDILGTSVHIVGEEDDLEGREIVAYLMMKIGAEYLSAFAET